MTWINPVVEEYDLAELSNSIKAKAYSYYQHYEMLNWANQAGVGSSRYFYDININGTWQHSVECKVVGNSYLGPVVLILGVYYLILNTGELKVTNYW